MPKRWHFNLSEKSTLWNDLKQSNMTLKIRNSAFQLRKSCQEAVSYWWNQPYAIVCHFALVLWPIITKDAAERVCATRNFICRPRGGAAENNFCMPKLGFKKKKHAEHGLLKATVGMAMAVLIVCCGTLYKGCWFQQCRVISAFSSQRLYSNQENSTWLSNTNKSPVNSSESLHPTNSTKKWKKRGLWRRWMTLWYLVATLSLSATDGLWMRFFSAWENTVHEEPAKDIGAKSFQEKRRKVIRVSSIIGLFTLNACEAGKPETFKSFQPGKMNTLAWTRKPLFNTVLFCLSLTMLSTKVMPESATWSCSWFWLRWHGECAPRKFWM